MADTYQCEYCTSEYNSPTAMFACEDRCRTDTGRD